MHAPSFYPVGTPGQAWGDAERAAWRARQLPQRSYADDVLAPLDALRSRFDVQQYGEVRYADEASPPLHFPLLAVRSRD